ncbi:MAG: NAD(P)-dependent oxidoreductase [Candidatus Omnitrophota bacterium]|nr:MAG: NAD(P)-dependent oxidoreductase [Candidatus Omnitrophota bacterium]
MKIIVFGGSGFLGSHVADVLSERGHDVTIFDLKPSSHLKGNQEIVIGDILDKKAVEDMVKAKDYVYNFAGIADIDIAKINPTETIRQNILGNSIILEACHKQRIKRILYASSVYVYSNSGSFYRTSKQACELLIEDYQKAYGLNFTVMRYGSLYGPRADEKNWVYCILKDALTKGKITRKGDGEEIREYIHVHDAARISADLLDERYVNEFAIISGNQTIKIKDLLVMIKEIMNNKIEIEYVPAGYEEHYEVTPYSFNPRIAKKIISNSYLDLGQGILDIIERIYKETPQCA